ncbi:MAG: hypothetical protein JNK28_15770 [Burkholderiaceae bacterium]|nr:hypothetical protein [Burkholderiaceae bacterium]
MSYDVFNTCFFVPDIGTATCAAWAQAWGTVLAIAGATAIGSWQLRHGRRLESYRRAEVLNALHVVLGEMSSASTAWLDSVAAGNTVRQASTAEQLRFAAKIIGEFPIDQVMYPRAIQALLYSKRHAVALLQAMDAGAAGQDLPFLHETTRNLSELTTFIEIEARRYGMKSDVSLK